MPFQLKSICYTVFVTLGSSLSLAVATACCGVSPGGKPVAFGDQTNIVIWDAATGTEHFIRDAKFRSEAPDFGFIAPTPSKPELSEASDQAFDTLASLKPKADYFGCGGPYGGGMPGATAMSVQVIQQVDVAGYRATTLLAGDSTALADWMRKNGYQTTPAVEKWTQVYINKRWYLTAFKVLDNGPIASTGTVRMSFKTNQPFNPYYVPSDNIKSGQKGTLKVFFVSAGGYKATVGSSSPWQAALWTASIPDDFAFRLAGQLKLPASAIPAGAQVEAFEDNDFPRTAPDDIYFSQLGPNYVQGGVGAVLVGGIVAYVWRRRARLAKSK